MVYLDMRPGRRTVRLRDVWILMIKSFVLRKKRECERDM
jgi:hypothetical protein